MVRAKTLSLAPLILLMACTRPAFEKHSRETFTQVRWTGQLRENNDFHDSRFSFSSLDGTKLGHADLRRVHFAHVDLVAADLSFSDLRDSEFVGCDLRQAVLVGADLRGARFDAFSSLPFSREQALARGMVFSVNIAE